MGGVLFGQTMWTQIQAAKGRDAAALESIVRHYRPAVEQFIVGQGFQEADAADLAQEVFLRIVEDGLLAKADRERGRFRSLLLGITKNVIGDWLRARGRQKRGGDAVIGSLDAGAGSPDAMHWGDLIAGEERDEGFDREWVANLVRLAMERFRQGCERTGSPHFDALFTHMNEDVSYAELAGRLGASETDVKNYLHHGKKKLRTHLEEVIRSYASSGDEFESERSYLAKFL